MSNMILYRSDWNEKPTFKMMPISQDCPFMEVIFDRKSKALAIISKDRQNKFQMVPRLLDNGDLDLAKVPRKNGKIFKETRVLFEALYEYYLTDKNDIEAFIVHFGKNALTNDPLLVDWKSILEEAFTVAEVENPSPENEAQ